MRQKVGTIVDVLRNYNSYNKRRRSVVNLNKKKLKMRSRGNIQIAGSKGQSLEHISSVVYNLPYFIIQIFHRSRMLQLHLNFWYRIWFERSSSQIRTFYTSLITGWREKDGLRKYSLKKYTIWIPQFEDYLNRIQLIYVLLM